MEKESKYIRPENLIEALGFDFKGLSEEERTMQKLLVEEYKKRQTNLLTEVRKWREDHPEATLGDSIQALYKELEQEETKMIDGKKYRKVFSGYTIRQFFSHSTLEKGTGHGWDTRWDMLRKYGIDNPSKLPDEPYYQWELVEDEE